jgi:hypothetical protein
MRIFFADDLWFEKQKMATSGMFSNIRMSLVDFATAASQNRFSTCKQNKQTNKTNIIQKMAIIMRFFYSSFIIKQFVNMIIT